MTDSKIEVHDLGGDGYSLTLTCPACGTSLLYVDRTVTKGSYTRTLMRCNNRHKLMFVIESDGTMGNAAMVTGWGAIDGSGRNWPF